MIIVFSVPIVQLNNTANFLAHFPRGQSDVDEKMFDDFTYISADVDLFKLHDGPAIRIYVVRFYSNKRNFQ